MRGTGWIDGPFGLDDEKGASRRTSRKVLMVAHNPAAATRLTDIAPLVATDPRIQTVWTVPPASTFVRGAHALLDSFDVAQISWEQAIRTRFDLAVAAQNGGLEHVHAPVLTAPHGVGFGKYPPRWVGHGRAVPTTVGGPEPGRLLARGRVVPARIVLAHERQREQLAMICPEAVPAAVVAGDPSYDRMARSLPFAGVYRSALGVPEHGRLVLVSSTWGPKSLFGRRPELISELMHQLPRSEFRVVVALHPNIWAWHGGGQIRAWYHDALRAGLVLLPPEDGWQAAAIAADWVIGDHGSVTYYAAALGTPPLLATFGHDQIDPRSQMAYLAKFAPTVHSGVPFQQQLEQASAAVRPEQLAALRKQLTGAPGAAARIFRREMYRLMKLAEPKTPAPCHPVNIPQVASDTNWPGDSENA